MSALSDGALTVTNTNPHSWQVEWMASDYSMAKIPLDEKCFIRSLFNVYSDPMIMKQYINVDQLGD